MREIVLENSFIRAIILPEFGGKISSFVFLENNYDVVSPNVSVEYLKSYYDTPFEKRDASGLDDAFPTIDAENIIINGRKYHYTDHGEIWRSEFDVLNCNNTKVFLQYYSQENKYYYKKNIELLDNSLIISYEIFNDNDIDYPCLWAFHGLMKYEEDMVLKYPKDTIFFLNACNDKLLGKEGEIFNIKNNIYDFNKVLDRQSKDTKKYYIKDKITEGFCAFEYPSKNIKCEYRFDHNKLPYLGVWITSGGYRNDYNCAFEPSNGYYDKISKCIKNNTLQFIKAKSSIKFDIKLTLNKIK